MNQPSSLSPEKDIALVAFLFGWRKTILLVGLIAALIALIITLPFITKPLYRSSVILYPAASNAVSKSLLIETSHPEQDILQFGEDVQTEQMLQILHSSSVRDRAITRFHLGEHYGFDTSSASYHTRLYNRFKRNVTFKRTEYMAIQISVLDQDPKMAADLANGIADILDSVKNDLQKERAMQGFRIVEKAYSDMQSEILRMEDSLTKLRQLGVHDYETQAEMINQQLAIEIAHGNTKAIQALDAKLAILAKYGGAYVSLRDALEYKQEQIGQLKSRYEEAKVDATQSLPQKFIVEKAYPSERKAYPLVWVTLIVSAISAMFFAAICLIFLHRWPEMKERLNAFSQVKTNNL